MPRQHSCCDQFIIIQIRAKWNFHNIKIVKENMLVKCAPGSALIDCLWLSAVITLMRFDRLMACWSVCRNEVLKSTCYYCIIAQFVFILLRVLCNKLFWILMITYVPNGPLNELISFGIPGLIWWIKALLNKLFWFCCDNFWISFIKMLIWWISNLMVWS